MDNVHDWTTQLTASVMRVANVFFDFLPSVVGAIALLLLGWLIARLLGSLTLHVTERGLERLSRQRVAHTHAIDEETRQSTAYRSAPTLLSRIVFWTVWVFFLAASIEALGLPAVSNVLTLVTAYLPRVLAAVLVVFFGIWAGEFARTMSVRAMGETTGGYAELMGRGVQSLVILVFVIIAIDQLGINSSILVVTLATVIAGTFGAAALAFALGARTTVANIIAARYVRRSYRVGDRVRIGELEGAISAIADTTVAIDAPDGRVLVPAAAFIETSSTLLREDQGRAGRRDPE